MIEFALMVEGQDGLNWDRWQKIARVAEDAGYVGLYRSDHFTNPQGPYKDSLECWTSMTWLASHTSRLEFGPLVSPVSFHHPSMLVRMASAIDDLSGGRLQFGIGAGWQEREHTNYGYPLGTIPERMARFREAAQIITHLLRNAEPLTFEGKYYQLHDAVLLPRPARTGGPKIVVGGNGKQFTLPLAARQADEWNAAFRTPEEFKELTQHLDTLLDKQGRPPSAVRRTLMTGVRFGRDQAQLDARLADRPVPEAARQRLIVGTPNAVRERVETYAAAGVQRVMLGWMDLDDLDGIRGLAEALSG